MTNPIPQVTPENLKMKLDAGESVTVLDVREPHEFQIANLQSAAPGLKFIPLGQVGQRLGELHKNAEIIVHCKMGGRSQQAAEQLHAAGFKNVSNLAGGITAWSDRVDKSVPKY